MGRAADLGTDPAVPVHRFHRRRRRSTSRGRPTGPVQCLALAGVVNIPIIYFSVRWWNTLHQGRSVSMCGAEDARSCCGTCDHGAGGLAYAIAASLMQVRAPSSRNAKAQGGRRGVKVRRVRHELGPVQVNSSSPRVAMAHACVWDPFGVTALAGRDRDPRATAAAAPAQRGGGAVKPRHKRHDAAVAVGVVALDIATTLVLRSLQQQPGVSYHRQPDRGQQRRLRQELPRVGGHGRGGRRETFRGGSELPGHRQCQDGQRDLSPAASRPVPRGARGGGAGPTGTGRRYSRAREVLAKHDENYMPPGAAATKQARCRGAPAGSMKVAQSKKMILAIVFRRHLRLSRHRVDA